MADITNHRRYCFLQYRLAVAYSEEMEAVWDAKRRAISGTALTTAFPSYNALTAAGYLVEEELDGADESELTAVGLSNSQAAAVIAAIG